MAFRWVDAGRSSANVVARSQSIKTGRPSQTRTFAGLMSLCTTPARCTPLHHARQGEGEGDDVDHVRLGLQPAVVTARGGAERLGQRFTAATHHREAAPAAGCLHQTRHSRHARQTSKDRHFVTHPLDRPGTEQFLPYHAPRCAGHLTADQAGCLQPKYPRVPARVQRRDPASGAGLQIAGVPGLGGSHHLLTSDANATS